MKEAATEEAEADHLQIHTNIIKRPHIITINQGIMITTINIKIINIIRKCILKRIIADQIMRVQTMRDIENDQIHNVQMKIKKYAIKINIKKITKFNTKIYLMKRIIRLIIKNINFQKHPFNKN
jgi:hypothetical protein